MDRSIRIFVLGVVVLAGSFSYAAIIPVGQPEYEFQYDYFEHQQASLINKLDYQVGPYSFDLMGDFTGLFSGWSRNDSRPIHMFAFAAEDYRAAKDRPTEAYESIRGGLAGRPMADLFVYADFVLDEELARDPDYSGKKWRGFAGDVDQAFVNYRTSRLNLLAGRFGSFWGPRNSLILSPNQKMDGLQYSVKWGWLTVSYRLAQLDGLNPDEDSVATFEPRYLAAHRLDFHLCRNLRVGLFETVLFGGPGRQIDLFYLNPIIFFHGSQLNEDLNDNTTVGIDFDWQPSASLKLYGQWLVDDIQLDNESRGDKEPDQFGILAGAHLANIGDWFDLQLEYSRVSNWTFNQMLDRNRYLNEGNPIGAIPGNDFDKIRLGAVRWWDRNLSTALNLGYCRQGEGRIDAEFSQPWLDAESDYSEPFPSGVVEKTLQISGQIKAALKSHLFVDIEAGAISIKNQFHVDGAEDNLIFVRAYVSLFYLSSLATE